MSDVSSISNPLPLFAPPPNQVYPINIFVFWCVGSELDLLHTALEVAIEATHHFGGPHANLVDMENFIRDTFDAEQQPNWFSMINRMPDEDTPPWLGFEFISLRVARVEAFYDVVLYRFDFDDDDE